jgi:conjugative transfer ATPase
MSATLKRWLGGSAGSVPAPEADANPQRPPPLTKALRARMAREAPSFTDKLPWTRFCEVHHVLEHADGQTLGAMLELLPVPCEARPEAYLQGLRGRVQAALQSLDERASPWIVQFFLNDDLDLEPHKSLLHRYISECHAKDPERSREIAESPFTKHFEATMARHLDRVSKPEGLFVDEQVTGQAWRGNVRRLRCVVYRRFVDDDEECPLVLLKAAVDGLTASFTQAGAKVKRCKGRDFYEWMLPFFNPKPGWTSAQRLADHLPYPKQSSPDEAPLNLDLSECLVQNQPKSDAKRGIWEFDDVKFKALVLQNITDHPQIGHFSAERLMGDKTYALFDRLPANAMLSLTVVIKSQAEVSQHVQRIHHKSRARAAEAIRAKAEAEQVMNRMALKDKLYPLQLVMYVSGQTDEQLSTCITQLSTQLKTSGLQLIDPRYDLTALDGFLRGLPMAFDPRFDQKVMKRSRLVFCSQIAALLPIYGRTRGSGRPGMWFWNRGGEPVLIDPLSSKDRKKVAHMVVLGPTGSGKSATLNYLCLQQLALRRPRLVIVDAGRSFELLLAHCESLGLTVNKVTMGRDDNISLAPFVHAYRLLDDPDLMQGYQSEAFERDELQPGVPKEDGHENEAVKRDYLGEMMFSAVMIVTGGNAEELKALGRADRYLLRRGLMLATMRCKQAGKPHPLVSDVAEALMGMRDDESMSLARRERAELFGQGMDEYCSGLKGRLFNRYGQAWPDADVTLVEMGQIMGGEHRDTLTLVFTSLLNHAQTQGEQNQYSGRETIFLVDEAHLFTQNEFVGPVIARSLLMWRKLGLWLWLATQSMQHFSNTMQQVLSMCEWWMLLTMDRAEIDQVARFKQLSAEQRDMLNATRKTPQQYTEGVLMTETGAGAQVNWLFRNVPPTLALALAMTHHGSPGRERAGGGLRDCA